MSTWALGNFSCQVKKTASLSIRQLSTYYSQINATGAAHRVFSLLQDKLRTKELEFIHQQLNLRLTDWSTDEGSPKSPFVPNLSCDWLQVCK